MSDPFIRLRGARQHNLKDLDLDLPLGRLIVVSGVSGSGKSSLVFDTLYAEAQRRYVETFSTYARQFLDRMPKPVFRTLTNVPPGVAIRQYNPMHNTRSTVGTMTEILDHLRVLYAHLARGFCPTCGGPIRRDDPQSAALLLLLDPALRGRRAIVRFEVRRPENFRVEELREHLARQGYVRVGEIDADTLEVEQDRLVLNETSGERLEEALRAAFRHGPRVVVVLEGPGECESRRLFFSTRFGCAACGTAHAEARPHLFSFNHPLGACPVCTGFGRVSGIDPGRVVPDPSRSLREGAIRPWQTDAYRQCHKDLLRAARARGVPVDRPWAELGSDERRWVWDGEGDGAWEQGLWYGVAGFFRWLESRSYKRHVRILLAQYRAYVPCPSCAGMRLRPEALDFRLGALPLSALVAEKHRLRPAHVRLDDAAYGRLPGLHLHELLTLPIEELGSFFDALTVPDGFLRSGGQHLLDAIRHRITYLNEVGLGYLTLDRPSRTLSGGELQRINLTTALGTGLVRTLFVLDEPSIGLHPRDVDRLVGILRRLRDAGNTVLVVEHDPGLLAAADHLVDLGPGAGEHGGRIVFEGPLEALSRAQGSKTADYLLGRLRVGRRTPRPPDETTAWLRVSGITGRNFHGVEVSVPLGRFVAVTGVSGSGKSTLVHDVLAPALSGRAPSAETAEGVAWGDVLGRELLAEAVIVDQTPPVRSVRSIPASHVGAWDTIRKIFAEQPLAVSRGYGPGHFSFNSPLGACPHCDGSGQETVDLPYLADVVLPCPFCQGTRYRPEILDVRLTAGSSSYTVTDVLGLTVTEARALFAARAEIAARLAALEDVGLGYLRLGQSFGTLSGGEAQRLKLAAYIAPAFLRTETDASLPVLFLFDEPTTGLHAADVDVLMRVFDRLLARGHTVLVVEHNLDVVAAADWVIDLGPEGGERGGRVVAATTPDRLADVPESHTGRALRARGLPGVLASPPPPPPAPSAIAVEGARVHNLAGVSVRIPHERLTVLTGVSGSGKSTLAFDVVFSEGQRRFLETLNAYVRQYVPRRPRAEVDAIEGLPPTVAIEQRTSRGGVKSTVATLTEIHPFLRLLYAHLGQPFCPECGLAIETRERDEILAEIARTFAGRTVELLAPIVRARKGHYRALGAWAERHGYECLRVDGEDVEVRRWSPLSRYRTHTIEIVLGPFAVGRDAEALTREFDRARSLGEGAVGVRGGGVEKVFSLDRTCAGCGRGFPPPDPYLFSFSSPVGWCPECMGTGLASTAEHDDEGEEPEACPACRGRRLRPEALAVRFGGQDIGTLVASTVDDAHRFLSAVRLEGRERAIGEELRREVVLRLGFLSEVGLGYLTLDRAAPTLSGGEAQRLRLAAQLGTSLHGVCYVLDEPSIGLHTVDQERLIRSLHRLRDAGNTVLVVEHDLDTMRASDRIIDLGPGAGRAGGRVVAQGTWREVAAAPTATGRALARRPTLPPKPRRAFRPKRDPALRLSGVRCRNLEGLDVVVPLGRLVVVTGVSGSGKSTLVRTVVRRAVLSALASRERRRGRASDAPPLWERCEGTEAIARVLEIDQSPIGKNPRSCPATYVGLWDDVRALYARTVDARALGYGVARFSYNTKAGACPHCEGQGVVHLEMQFLPDVHVPCEVCGGRRYAESVEAVRWQGRSVGDLLALTVSEARPLFASHPKIDRSLSLLDEVGLGYLALGQPSPTLSGGEAQRLKLVSELARTEARCSSPTLYILDEPTVGLHEEDVARLLQTLDRLVAAGHSVLVIEHNLDVVAAADWIIDLGPGGGPAGGRVVGAGPPQRIRRLRTSTGRALDAYCGGTDAPIVETTVPDRLSSGR
jgi:excinuclease ABC subunit A